MSFAYPLVVAFSQNQLAAPVADRIKDVESALLYLRREGVSAFDPHEGEQPIAQKLEPFLRHEFYDVVTTSRTGEETCIQSGRHSLQQLDYVFLGHVVSVPLTSEQQEAVRDFGFDVRPAPVKAAAYAL